MWERLRKYLQAIQEQRMVRQLMEIRPQIELNRKFFVDGRLNGVQINIVADYGRQWINVTTVKPFGLESSAWKGRAGSKSRHRRKQGLKRQTEKMLRAARVNTVWCEPPRVIVRFTRGVSRPIAEALRAMGAEVEGDIIEPPPPRAAREAK